MDRYIFRQLREIEILLSKAEKNEKLAIQDAIENINKIKSLLESDGFSEIYNSSVRSELQESNYRLLKIEKKLDSIQSMRPTHCKYSDEAGQPIQMLTAMSDSKAQSGGVKRFAAEIASLYEGQKVGAIVDPYIFALGSNSLQSHCKDLNDIIPTKLNTIDFFFSQVAYVNAIAQSVYNHLLSHNKHMKISFYSCTNLHDRVYLSHFDDSTPTPPAKSWKGTVAGSSINGIGLRPTYVIPMPPDDARDYSTYLRKLRQFATVSSTPPP